MTPVAVVPLPGATDVGLDVQSQPAGGPDAPFTALVPAGVRLERDFVATVASALSDAPAGTVLYSDFRCRDEVVPVGDWSKERSRWQDYTGPVLVVPTANVLPGVSPDRPAALRTATEVRHVAQALYRTDQDTVAPLTESQRSQAIAGLPYRLAAGRRIAPVAPTVSVVIPTRLTRRGGQPLLDRCLASLGLRVRDWQVVLVLDEDVDPAALRHWRELLGSRLVELTIPGPFNFSRKVNAGATVAQGEILVLLNDDVIAHSPHDLEELAAVALESDVGAAGPLLLYPDGSVQHRGHAFSPAGVHLIDSGRPAAEPGPRDRNLADRDVTGVTGACLVQRRAVWEQMRGLDPAFPVAFNDVDYCEAMRAAGLRIVLCNSVTMTHDESRTRVGSATQAEVDRLTDRWPHSIMRPDPLTPGSSPPAAGPWWRRLGRGLRADSRA